MLYKYQLTMFYIAQPHTVCILDKVVDPPALRALGSRAFIHTIGHGLCNKFVRDGQESIETRAHHTRPPGYITGHNLCAHVTP